MEVAENVIPAVGNSLDVFVLAGAALEIVTSGTVESRST
jgi:hypothetical protein